jgi:hypothetical protein
MSRLARGLALLAVLAACGQASAGEWRCLDAGGGSRKLRFDKGITEGEFDRFRDAFRRCFGADYAGQRTIELNSGGGSVSEALAIARALSDVGAGARPVATQVARGSICISACTYLFVSGRLRDVATGGTFEPHGFSAFKGMPIDRAIIRAADKAGNVAWNEVQLQGSRLLALHDLLPALVSSDARFGFAAQWIEQAFAGKGAMARAAQGFVQLEPDQRRFVQSLDVVLGTAVPELERVAALKAFEPVMLAGGGQPVPEVDEARFAAWIADELAFFANHFLRERKDKGPVRLDDAFRQGIAGFVRERASGVADTVRNQLHPYLSTRADQIDVAGLVRLMFSVSILYTRPLTREELCDLNVVNRDCAS